jgi:hypothetical protein
MDYIEDVSVIENPDDPTSIHLYQVKTKSADQQYQLSTVISEEWYQKLYKNAQKYDVSLGGAAVVCNTDVVASKKSIFPNAKTTLGEFDANENVKKIKQAISKDLGIPEEAVDLSKFYFLAFYPRISMLMYLYTLIFVFCQHFVYIKIKYLSN